MNYEPCCQVTKQSTVGLRTTTIVKRKFPFPVRKIYFAHLLFYEKFFRSLTFILPSNFSISVTSLKTIIMKRKTFYAKRKKFLANIRDTLGMRRRSSASPAPRVKTESIKLVSVSVTPSDSFDGDFQMPV